MARRWTHKRAATTKAGSHWRRALPAAQHAHAARAVSAAARSATRRPWPPPDGSTADRTVLHRAPAVSRPQSLHLLLHRTTARQRSQPWATVWPSLSRVTGADSVLQQATIHPPSGTPSAGCTSATAAMGPAAGERDPLSLPARFAADAAGELMLQLPACCGCSPAPSAQALINAGRLPRRGAPARAAPRLGQAEGPWPPPAKR